MTFGEWENVTFALMVTVIFVVGESETFVLQVKVIVPAKGLEMEIAAVSPSDEEY